MQQHKITKRIDFCYGHRLLDHKGKCRHLHGHNAVLEIDMESNTLDSNGMVIDFGDVRNKVKEWVDMNLDHKMILCKKDPAIRALQGLQEPYYVMDDNPTAENIAKLIFKEMHAMGLLTTEVRLWETPTSAATYRLTT